ncbi:MAG: cytochrome c oxidase assembly protein [Pyrinomonadaceae bacterium]|nr:cytochrome c oxidase assembly protein [Pyrinomonadaceae bacterium]
MKKLGLRYQALLPLAFLHEGKPHNWHDLWRTWGWEPVVLLSLALSAFLYVRGVRRLWLEASVGRGTSKLEAACFIGGWLALFVALVSPLHPWGRVLFSAHMTQHEVLMLVAAPLFVLSRPLVPFLWALPLAWAREIGGWGKQRVVQAVWGALKNPLVAWAIHAVALWMWHTPALFDATIHSEWVHTLQHASFFFSALLFWWAVVHGPQGVMGYGAATLYMFTTSLHSGLLGALITFAASAWYPAYQTTTETWGLTPLEDQQLGGLIMWIPAGLVYIVAGLMLFAGWLRESETRALRREMKAEAMLKQG